MFGRGVLLILFLCLHQPALSCRSKVDDEREPILAKHVSTLQIFKGLQAPKANDDFF